MDTVYLKIYEGDNKFDRLSINAKGVSKELLADSSKPTRKKYTASIDPVLLHLFIKELVNCDNCRSDFIKNIKRDHTVNTVKFNLVPTEIDTIDYNWNEKVSVMVRERCELDHTLSWLSTLGGAFSALGDYFTNMAEMAGKISMHQLQLALRLHDPTITARCRLYFSLSLIQRKQFKAARNIIRYEYQNALVQVVRDERLIKMCLGIWAKLQYEMNLKRHVLSVKNINQ